MEKLLHRINGFNVTKEMKAKITKIADDEGLYHHQVVRRLIEKGLNILEEEKAI